MPTGIAWLFGVLILPAAGWFLVVALAQSTAVEEALWLPSDARVLGPITLGLLGAGMAHRVGPNGQITIPEGFLQVAGLAPGDAVDIDLDEEGRIILRTTTPEATSLAGRFAGSGMTERLLEDRRNEPR